MSSVSLRMLPPTGRLARLRRAGSDVGSSRLIERHARVYRHAWLVFASGVFEPLFYLLSGGLAWACWSARCRGRAGTSSVPRFRRAWPACRSAARWLRGRLCLFSTTFYPLSVYPRAVQVIVECMLLYQGVVLLRDLPPGWLVPIRRGGLPTSPRSGWSACMSPAADLARSCSFDRRSVGRER